MLSTDQKGSIAEAAVVWAAIKLGIGVFKPLTDGERYDLIFRVQSRLVRVQCKWAARKGDVVVVPCFSCRRTANGFPKRRYTPDEIDAIAAYCAELDECYFLPAALVSQRTYLQLRLAPSRNNQARGINWASDYEFEATLRGLVGP